MKGVSQENCLGFLYKFITYISTKESLVKYSSFKQNNASGTAQNHKMITSFNTNNKLFNFYQTKKVSF